LLAKTIAPVSGRGITPETGEQAWRMVALIGTPRLLLVTI